MQSGDENKDIFHKFLNLNQSHHQEYRQKGHQCKSQSNKVNQRYVVMQNISRFRCNRNHLCVLLTFQMTAVTVSMIAAEG